MTVDYKVIVVYALLTISLGLLIGSAVKINGFLSRNCPSVQHDIHYTHCK